MSISYTQDGDNKVLTWSKIGPSAKMDNALNDAGKFWYNKYYLLYDENGDEIAWDSLNLTQKKAVLDRYYTDATIASAKKNYIAKAEGDAKETATTEAETRYQLEDE